MFWKRRDEVKSDKSSVQRETVPGDPGATSFVVPVPVLRPSLGPDTAVSGRLSFTVPTRIDGKLRGEVRASELLVVGEDAVVEGVVRALNLVVYGEVRGDVRGAQSVEIAAGGRLMGTVETQSLIVKEGGCLDGDCRIAPPRAQLRILRPVSAG